MDEGRILGQVRWYLRLDRHSGWWTGEHCHCFYVDLGPSRHHLRSLGLQNHLSDLVQLERGPRRFSLGCWNLQCMSRSHFPSHQPLRMLTGATSRVVMAPANPARLNWNLRLLMARASDWQSVRSTSDYMAPTVGHRTTERRRKQRMSTAQ